MAEKDSRKKPDAGNAAEAEQLAREALEERRGGNEEEAKFVLDEARDLDRGAVEKVLKEQTAKG
ncbi:MAG: hypothetical protein BGO51_21160 [Rhodospirillales bacterium 69-11]|nr:hypothetical protein [Rhodospirillales bacterium]MBN8925012.1 hypothetical protein [Rhodospirillales bacterium]OJW27415.1 MAG: hypothetical protein BGO51_21160 [Rhodospirillales bacterium 69-11]